MRSTVFFQLLFFLSLSAAAQFTRISGVIRDKLSGQPVQGALVRLSNSLISASTDRNGNFVLQPARRGAYQLIIRHLSYETKTADVKDSGMDSTFVQINIHPRSNLLDSITVTAVMRPETLVGKPGYSIHDFDFAGEDFLLLTDSKNSERQVVRLADNSGNILLDWQVPVAAGPAQRLHRDFEGFTELVCRDSIFRIEIFNQDFMISTVRKRDFTGFLEAVSDSLDDRYYWTNRSEYYPAMEYYWLKHNDSISNLLRSISNDDLLKLYNLEYYYLPARARLEADRMAKAYNTDKHIVAALMSGFTSGMYYEPLYAPLFVLNDTICIFNHHNDYLFHYDRNSKLIDSVKISYHHPKNWREWKKKMFVDEEENRTYAYFSRDGHHYLKLIDHRNGREIFTYKLKNHSAGNIKIRGGYAYYVYRPFESTQQKFLYREKIRKE